MPVRVVAVRTWKSANADRLFGHAAELGFYFFFALFPTLFCAGSILGLVARSAHQISDKLLDTLALVIPNAALGAVLSTFNQTAGGASSGKLTFSFIVAVWSASSGISAVQDTLNVAYKIDDSRSYLVARAYAIGLTVVLTLLATLGLAAILGGEVTGKLAYRHLPDRFLSSLADIGAHAMGELIAMALLILSFALTYYWAPDRKKRVWHWLTPGSTFGILGWLIASLALRVYLHYFNTYGVTYGSLGAVIILLTWFYITGLMLLFGAEIDSEIEAAVAETRLKMQSAAMNGPEDAW